MNFKLVIFENRTQSESFDITQAQVKQILGVVDYTPEQYKILSEITGLSESYFMNDYVDYYIDD